MEVKMQIWLCLHGQQQSKCWSYSGLDITCIMMFILFSKISLHSYSFWRVTEQSLIMTHVSITSYSWLHRRAEVLKQLVTVKCRCHKTMWKLQQEVILSIGHTNVGNVQTVLSTTFKEKLLSNTSMPLSGDILRLSSVSCSIPRES